MATDVERYHAMLGETEAGLELLESGGGRPAGQLPLLISRIAETYSDLSDVVVRCAWGARAFAAGAPTPVIWVGLPSVG